MASAITGDTHSCMESSFWWEWYKIPWDALNFDAIFCSLFIVSNLASSSASLLSWYCMFLMSDTFRPKFFFISDCSKNTEFRTWSVSEMLRSVSSCSLFCDVATPVWLGWVPIIMAGVVFIFFLLARRADCLLTSFFCWPGSVGMTKSLYSSSWWAWWFLWPTLLTNLVRRSTKVWFVMFLCILAFCTTFCLSVGMAIRELMLGKDRENKRVSAWRVVGFVSRL